jgi:hypothetical protein
MKVELNSLCVDDSIRQGETCNIGMLQNRETAFNACYFSGLMLVSYMQIM